jgi:hypothetical protein
VIGSLRRVLSDREERRVVSRVLIDRMLAGDERIGDALDHLERMSRPARRELVDGVCEDLGYETISRREFDAELRRRQANAPPRRDGDGRSLQICHEPGCSVQPLGPTGAPVPVVAKRWWCEQHRHLAALGDLEPWQSGLRWTPGARGVIDLEEQAAEAQRIEAELARRAARRAEEQARRRIEDQEARAVERAREEQLKREMR